MSFSAKLICDETGCIETHLGNEDAAEAGWFIDHVSGAHYCPIHAAAARAELQNEPEDD
ncbi:hypothetical protein [Vibrio quintilis]|uniref:Uncharacterized protein n=1 Tax=Vibrio quintilis TaxID=1117707 RepID=A0A1M7Z1E2_9VIBR|nr:hypothetical protein [Vibrio quintilis]SHO58767.1 hypothetical protein VQ7734_04539 [Vibrio quintilis]